MSLQFMCQCVPDRRSVSASVLRNFVAGEGQELILVMVRVAWPFLGFAPFISRRLG